MFYGKNLFKVEDILSITLKKIGIVLNFKKGLAACQTKKGSSPWVYEKKLYF
jgi:hypothetical protein